MPKVIDNRYKVIEKLGTGGAGEVYRVYDKVKEREIALKLLIHSESEERLLRLKREFVTVVGMKHPNIVQVYDFVVREKEASYFTMEYIDGVDLTELVRSLKQKKEKYNLLFTLIVQICQALEFIHSRGLVHCDIKPGNVLITKGKKPSSRLLDFGLAESVDLSVSEGMKGTVEYMAPEVIRGYPLDRRADLYSLGVLLYEAVVGRPPFQGTTPVSVFKQHLQEKATPPDELTKEIPQGLSQIIVKLLTKRPEDRYQSAREVLSEIEDLTGKSVTLASEKGWLLSGCFAGREKESSHLNSLLNKGKGVAILLSGDLGIGKTRLIQEFRVQSQLSGWGFWESACHQEERMTYALITDVLRNLVRGIGPKQSDLLEKYAEALSYLEPRSKRTDSASVSPVPEAERTWLFDTIVQFLIELSQRDPYVLFVDDIEWAEEGTIQFLRYLIRNIERGRIILCLALCEEQVVRREALEPMIEDVKERIHLQGLGRDGIDVLTTSMLGGDKLSPGHTDRILEETRGNPLFVQELMRSMVDKALVFRHNKWVIEEAAFEDVVVSKTMKHVLRNRLKGLKKQVYDVLETGSMFSKEFELSLIKEIVEYSDEDLLSAVGELLRRRLIVERADGYSFAGSQLRSVVYEAAKKDRRRKLHQAIAELLETRAGEKTDAVAGELAFHFARGVNREKALDFSIKAGNAAKSLYANNEAARYFEQALTLIDKKNDRYGWLVRELGDTYRLTGEYDRAIDRYRKGLLLSLSTSEKAGIYCDIGVSYRKKGEHRSALEAYDRSMAILRENGDERVKARLLQETSWIYQAQADYDKALTAAFKGLRIARRNNDLQEMERIYHNLGTVYLRKGKPDTSMRCFNKSLEIKRKTNDLRGQAASHNNLGVVYSVKGDWDKALHHYARGLDIHEKTKDPTGTAMGYKNLGIVCYRQSDLTKAEEYYRKALDIEQRIGDSVGIAGSYNNIGLVQNKQRRWQEAIDSFNRSLKMKEKAGDTRGIAGCYNNLGSVYKSQGDWDKAASYYRRSLGLKEKIKDSLGTANSLTNLGSVYTDQGKNKQALSCLERAREIGDRIGSKSTLLDVHQALGLLYLNKKETEESLTHSMEALNLAMKLGSRREEGTVCQLLCRVHRLMGNDRKAEEYLSRSIKLLKKAKMEVELAEAYFEMGEWKLQSGDAEAGRQYLREAREIFERLGMEEDLRKAKDVLKPSVSKDLVGVYQISTIINSILDLRQLLDKIMDIAIDTLGAQRGVLILKDEETGELRMDVARGVEREDIEDATLISESIVKDVASGGNPLLTTDAIGDSRFESRRSVVDYHITSVLCVPLKIREKAIGAIYLDHRKVSDLFDSDDLSFLTTFANLAAVAIENARLHEKLQKENIYLRHETEERYKFGNMVTKNSKMRKLYQLMERVADTSTSILLEGETGTGKEVVARTIHYNGPRREKKFVPVDCATIPHTLFEGELFGYVKGAFTGATSDKKGLFAEADGGTLFLDEVANISLEAQAKLLRAIQEREVRRLGDDKSRKVDIRIIAASNIDLKAEVKAKRFRPDLYYRLNVITVKLPPLCERKEDIPLLAQLFLEKYWKQVKVGQGFDVDCKGFAESTMKLLLDYNWPGNVRELEHQIERAVTLTSGDLITEDLLSIKPAFVGAGLAPALKEFPTFEPKEGALKDAVETLEQEMIERALRKCKHKKDAAEVLGLSRFGLDKKLERYGMKRG